MDGNLLLCFSAASAAYLRSVDLPLECVHWRLALLCDRQGVGGVAGPILFGALIDTGSRSSAFAGYLLAALMLIAAAVGWRYGRTSGAR